MNILKERALTKAVNYHLDNDVPFTENIFRPHSEMSNRLFAEAKYLFAIGKYIPEDQFEKDLLATDIGEYGYYEDKAVPLDFPLQDETSSKKFFVYVKDRTSGRIKKISFTPRIRTSVKENDRTKPNYWICRLPQFAKFKGLCGGNHNFTW